MAGSSKRKGTLLRAVLFVLGICLFVSGCSGPPGITRRQESQCMTNMMEVWYSIRRAVWNDIEFPSTLEVLSNRIGRANALLCPSRGRSARSEERRVGKEC